MLPKNLRLTSTEVRAVLHKGRPVRVGGVSARYTSNKAIGPAQASKAAVVVSTKVAKKAVERNRLRRMGYKTLAAHWHTLPRGIHLVLFIGRADADLGDIIELCLRLS